MKLLLLLLISFSAYATRTIDDDLAVNGKVTVTSTTKASVICPVMTTTQRDAVSSPANGSCVYNSTTKALNTYNTTDVAWSAVGSSGSAETVSVSYGTTNLATNCTASPCYSEQIGSSISSVTRASTGNYSIVFGATYSKIKCAGSFTQAGVGEAVATAARCESCSTLSGIQTIRGGSNVDTVGTIICQIKP